jgi:hypothetical protein
MCKNVLDLQANIDVKNLKHELISASGEFVNYNDTKK